MATMYAINSTIRVTGSRATVNALSARRGNPTESNRKQTGQAERTCDVLVVHRACPDHNSGDGGRCCWRDVVTCSGWAMRRTNANWLAVTREHDRFVYMTRMSESSRVHLAFARTAEALVLHEYVWLGLPFCADALAGGVRRRVGGHQDQF